MRTRAGPSALHLAFPAAILPDLAVEHVGPRPEGWPALGPAWPLRYILVGLYWMCREIELSNILLSDAHVSADGLVATLTFPVTKTDVAAQGVSRSLRCACATFGKNNDTQWSALAARCADNSSGAYPKRPQASP